MRLAGAVLRLVVSGTLALGLLGLVSTATVTAMSTTFTVDSTADTHDATPGDGVCADSQGNCTLRAALEEINAQPAGLSFTITVPADTYTLTLGTLTISVASTITINGASQGSTTVSGNQQSKVLTISNQGANVTLTAVTVTGGSISNGNGGGIDNAGTLVVSNSTISGNMATGGFGGGIDNAGTLVVSNSTISGNMATGGFGGGIDNSGTLTVSNTTFSNNSAAFGGGLNNDNQATLTNVTVTGNSAVYTSNGEGGGIRNSYSGTLTLNTSAVSKNTAPKYSDGGGIHNEGTLIVNNSTISGNSTGTNGGGIEDLGGLTISGSTISDNSAVSYGGGIDDQAQSPATVTISNSTISGNSAGTSSGGGLYNTTSTGSVLSYVTIAGNSDGIINRLSYGQQDQITLQGVLLANTGANCSAGITDQGYNLDSGTSCHFTQSTSLSNIDPKLGPLANNGGPTETMALLPGSPAIDAGGTSSNNCPLTDQRGVSRPQGKACDIGAYELVQVVTPTSTPTATPTPTPTATPTVTPTATPTP
ncbi:MAG: CSLREA domain-containing protein, partial [Chloroflexi bacterium]|nr:CSLREA domain-containing protein [Chloroflexota bacterium]